MADPSARGAPPARQHGVNCPKAPHGAGGFLHLPEDDGPYDVDGVTYCGRCHEWLEVDHVHGAGKAGPSSVVRDLGEATEFGDRVCEWCNQQVPRLHRCAAGPSAVSPPAELRARLDEIGRHLMGYVMACIETGDRPSPAVAHAIALLSTIEAEPAPVSGVRVEDGAALIAAERRRQTQVEGWTAEHDDAYEGDELLVAAAKYLDASMDFDHGVRVAWPFDPAWWKPSDDPIRNLVKAGALIAAQIDRLARLRGPAAGAEAPRWQPIETADKDAAAILLSDGVTVDVGGWVSAADQGAEPEEEYRVSAGWWLLHTIDMQPTCWQPLPDPPARRRGAPPAPDRQK